MKVLVLGYFGLITSQLDGQTIKTRQLYKLIKTDIYHEVEYFDTECFKKNKINILKMFWLCVVSDKIIYLPAHNNLKYLFPIIFLISKLFNNKIYYFVVGGWLDKFINQKKMHTFFLKKIYKILVETEHLKKNLEHMGFINVSVFPNFRFFKENLNIKMCKKSINFVFLSRVQIKKGIDFIIKLAKLHQDKSDFFVDIYGPISINEKDYILSEIDSLPNIRYLGEVNPDSIQKVLLDYDIMLLPTHYYTEGLPGAVIDAMISNLPLVVSEWQYAHEFIKDGETGLIYSFDDFIDFSKKIDFLLDNREMINSMKKKVSKEKVRFSSDYALKLLKEIFY